jgi:hypothetical protein
MVREPIILQVFRVPSANVRNFSAVPVATRTVLEPDQRLGPALLAPSAAARFLARAKVDP